MKVIESYNWKYIDETEADAPIFKIIPSEYCKKENPTNLYKYYSLNDNAIDALEHSYLYAPHPGQLNDTFDCDEELVDLNNIETIDYLKNHLWKSEINSFKLSAFKLSFYQWFGIISMTDDIKNILMWAYYSNHKGFALEFNFNKINFDNRFHGPFQVNYQSKIKPIIVNNDTGAFLPFLYQSNIKHEIWKHESEWRFLAHKKQTMTMPGWENFSGIENRKFYFEKGYLQSITLGSGFLSSNDFNLEERCIEFKKSDHIFKKKRIVNLIIDMKIKAYIICPPFLSNYLRNESKKSVNQDLNFSLTRYFIEFEKLADNKFKVNSLTLEE